MEDDDNRDTKRRRETVFNAAATTLNVLALSFAAATEYSRQLDAFNWYHILRQIRKQIWAKMTAEEKKKLDEMLLSPKIKQMLEENCKNISKSQSLFIPGNFYDILDNAEILLRESADRAGMLLPEKKSFMDNISEE
jgi:hypothetical protein